MAEMSDSTPQRETETAPNMPHTNAAGSVSSGPLTAADQAPPTATLQCCCGRTGCVYLKHNCSLLESVENDVRTAAKLGQSLLERHEAYMADAERDRAELIKRIGQLEMDKKELEAENAKKIEENRALLDQLETLNGTVSESDTHIKMLEATLQSSQQIIRRLEGAAERAEDMERHLAVLEAEQAVLQNSLVNSESEARSAVQRWKRAERGIADLQYQLEKMEKEAREEQERHLEIVGRMERQRAVEKELNTAAGRLKGAAAAKSLQENKNNDSAVVTHFVRDLLQDNANLQLGMAELREMLMNSNDEIQLLRDQLMFHQPLPATNTSATSTLRAELEVDEALPESSETEERLEAKEELPQIPATLTAPATQATTQPNAHRPSLSQELHIHHHYHVSKKAEPKKPKKKRLSLTPGVFTPPAARPVTPLSRYVYSQDSSSSASVSESPSRRSSRHISRDSVSTAVSGPSNRWSVFSDQPSEFGMSSVPSSPRTEPRNSIFDRTALSDISLPVSPTTSVDPLSPLWRPLSRLTGLDDSLACGYPPPAPLSLSVDQPQFPEPIIEDAETGSIHNGAVAEEDLLHTSNLDDVPDLASNATGTADDSVSSEASTPTPTQGTTFSSLDDLQSTVEEATLFLPPTSNHRPLHRAVSHESIISLQGGLDIHTLKARPSQLTLRPLGTAVADTGISSITARPVISRGSPDVMKSNALLRDSLTLGLPSPRSTRIVSSPLASASLAGNSAPTPATAATISGSRRFGKFVGWRPWGGGNSMAAPTTTVVTAPSISATATSVAAPALDVPEPALAQQPRVESAGTPARVPESTPESEEDRNNNGDNLGSKAKMIHSPNARSVIQDREVLRSPGINQPGAIPGFLEYWAAHQRRGPPSKVRADAIDREALRDGLEDS